MDSETSFTYDPAGFPMVWIEEIRAHLHWLPVTKIQFEHFLCDVTDRAFDATWYDQVLGLNPRVSPRDVNERNYWRAFLTGALPAEVERFARWCGEGFRIPTVSEWHAAYTALKALEPARPAWSEATPQRVRTLLDRIESAWERAADRLGYPRTRAHQMLLRLGVMEWVEDTTDGYRWGGMGEPHPDFHGLLFTPEAGKAARPRLPETDRIHYYGFRLLRAAP